MPRYLYLQVRHSGDPRQLSFAQIEIRARDEASAKRKGATKLAATTPPGMQVQGEFVTDLDADDAEKSL